VFDRVLRLGLQKPCRTGPGSDLAILLVRFQIFIGMPFLCLHRISLSCRWLLLDPYHFPFESATYLILPVSSPFGLFLSIALSPPSIVLRFHRLHGWSLISLLPSNADPLSLTDITFAFSTIKFLLCQWSPFQEEMAHTAQVKFREPSPTISLQDATWFEWLFLDRGRFTPFISTTSTDPFSDSFSAIILQFDRLLDRSLR